MNESADTRMAYEYRTRRRTPRKKKKYLLITDTNCFSSRSRRVFSQPHSAAPLIRVGYLQQLTNIERSSSTYAYMFSFFFYTTATPTTPVVVKRKAKRKRASLVTLSLARDAFAFGSKVSLYFFFPPTAKCAKASRAIFELKKKSKNRHPRAAGVCFCAFARPRDDGCAARPFISSDESLGVGLSLNGSQHDAALPGTTPCQVRRSSADDSEFRRRT